MEIDSNSLFLEVFNLKEPQNVNSRSSETTREDVQHVFEKVSQFANENKQLMETIKDQKTDKPINHYYLYR